MVNKDDELVALIARTGLDVAVKTISNYDYNKNPFHNGVNLCMMKIICEHPTFQCLLCCWSINLSKRDKFT